jgi:hypothetical protein
MNIICFSDIAWNFLWQRNQQILTHFPEDWKIVHVEPSFWKSILLRILNLYLRIDAPTTRTNIKIVSIPTVPFFDGVRSLRRINDFIIVNYMRAFLRRHHLYHPILIFYHPRFSCVIGKLHEKLTCYEVIDDKLEFEAIPDWIEGNHEFLVQKADIITVSANTLYQKISKKRTDGLFLVENGADSSHFKKALEEIEVPADIQNIKEPILGFIGAVGEWVDFTLLEEILRKYPNIAVVMIGWIFGKQRKTVRRLSDRYSNLHLLGMKPYERLPNYVKAFTAGIIPFKVYELTKGMNPGKFYQYLAAGKPVISTALPELERYRDVVLLAHDVDEFLDLVGKVLVSKYDTTKFLQVAEQNDWKYKAAEILKIINSHKKTDQVNINEGA